MKLNYLKVFVITIISAMFISACSSGVDLSKDNYSEIERFAKAKQSELENSLIDFEKIDDASVTLVLDNKKSAASIILSVSEVIDATETDKIIQFVSKSVENLEKENIQITDQHANTIYPIN